MWWVRRKDSLNQFRPPHVTMATFDCHSNIFSTPIFSNLRHSAHGARQVSDMAMMVDVLICVHKHREYRSPHSFFFSFVFLRHHLFAGFAAPLDLLNMEHEQTESTCSAQSFFYCFSFAYSLSQSLSSFSTRIL